jgi:hypothetical protein
MPCSFSAGASTIIFKQYGNLVVLVDNQVLNSIALRLKEVAGPQYLWHDVINAYQFGFSGTFSVQLLLPRGSPVSGTLA